MLVQLGETGKEGSQISSREKYLTTQFAGNHCAAVDLTESESHSVLEKWLFERQLLISVRHTTE